MCVCIYIYIYIYTHTYTHPGQGQQDARGGVRREDEELRANTTMTHRQQQ